MDKASAWELSGQQVRSKTINPAALKKEQQLLGQRSTNKSSRRCRQKISVLRKICVFDCLSLSKTTWQFIVAAKRSLWKKMRERERYRESGERARAFPLSTCQQSNSPSWGLWYHGAQEAASLPVLWSLLVDCGHKPQLCCAEPCHWMEMRRGWRLVVSATLLVKKPTLVSPPNETRFRPCANYLAVICG